MPEEVGKDPDFNLLIRTAGTPFLGAFGPDRQARVVHTLQQFTGLPMHSPRPVSLDLSGARWSRYRSTVQGSKNC